MTKCRIQNFPRLTFFYGKLRSCIPLETEYTDYVNILNNVTTTEQAIIELKLLNPPSTGVEKNQNLQQKWKQEQMSLFLGFFLSITKRCCSHLRIFAKNDCFLIRQRYRYVKTWLYFTKLGQHLRKQICRYKILYRHGRREMSVEENSKRCCYWSLYRSYTQSSC